GYGARYALESDGSVWAWGYDFNGEVGDGTTADNTGNIRTSPVQVLGPYGDPFGSVVGLAAGSSAYHVLALVSTAPLPPTPSVTPGTLPPTVIATPWAWGRDDNNQLGVLPAPTCGLGNMCAATAAQVNSLSGVSFVAAGSSHSLAIKNNGTLSAWGANGS